MSDLRTCPTCESSIVAEDATFCAQCGHPVAGIESITGYVADSIAFDETSEYVLPEGLADGMTPLDRAYLLNEKRHPRYQSVLDTPVLGSAVTIVFTTLNMLTAGKLGKFTFGECYEVLAREDELTEGEWVECDVLPLDRYDTDSGWRLVEVRGGDSA